VAFGLDVEIAIDRTTVWRPLMHAGDQVGGDEMAQPIVRVMEAAYSLELARA
jgi:hypothetical protein